MSSLLSTAQATVSEEVQLAEDALVLEAFEILQARVHRQAEAPLEGLAV